MTSNNCFHEKWEESEWFKKWLELATQDYHGYRGGYWQCFIKKRGRLEYKFSEEE